MDSHPPERIALPDLVLRRGTVDDATMIAASVTANLDWLAEWMPWAHSAAATVEAQRARMLDVVRQWDEAQAFEYLAISPDTGAHLGNFGMERRAGPGAIDLGYWLTASAAGHGYATAATRALTEAGLALPGIDRVEIHCDEANRRSAAIPERLGYRLDRIQQTEITAPAETGRRQIWVTP